MTESKDEFDEELINEYVQHIQRMATVEESVFAGEEFGFDANGSPEREYP